MQVKDAIQTELSDNPGDRPRRAQRSLTGRGGAAGGGSSKYSRLEAEVAAMQRDSGTYCDEPPDTDAYEAWLQVRPRTPACLWRLHMQSASAQC